VILIDSDTECDDRSAAAATCGEVYGVDEANTNGAAAAGHGSSYEPSSKHSGKDGTEAEQQLPPSKRQRRAAAANHSSNGDAAGQHEAADGWDELDYDVDAGHVVDANDTDSDFDPADEAVGSPAAGRQQYKQQQQQQEQQQASRAAGKPAAVEGRPRSAAGAGSWLNGGRKQQQQSQAEKLQLLHGMGFTGARAERALWVSKGDVDRAIEWCLSSS
jgi:hypothetical protein